MPKFNRFHRLSKREADVERDKWATEVLSLLAEQEHRSNDVGRLAAQWSVIIEAERKVEEERERQEAKEERERQKAEERRERNEKFWVAVLKAAFVSLTYAAILAVLLGISSVEVFLLVVIGCGLFHFFLVQPLWEYVKTRSSKKRRRNENKRAQQDRRIAGPQKGERDSKVDAYKPRSGRSSEPR